MFLRRSGQQKERTTGGADSMSGEQQAGCVARGGADNRRRGQREERTAGVADSWECGGRLVRGQREVYEERTARRTSGGEDSHNGG